MNIAMNDLVTILTPNVFFPLGAITLLAAAYLFFGFVVGEVKKIFRSAKSWRRRRNARREILRRAERQAEQRKYDKVFEELTMRMRT